MLSCFHLIPERHGQTDRQTDKQTDRFAISISRVSMLTRDENRWNQQNKYRVMKADDTEALGR